MRLSGSRFGPAPYMPSLQPIELSWQHGKQSASFNFEMKRTMVKGSERVVRRSHVGRAGDTLETYRL